METYAFRDGRNVPADEAFFAWTSSDLPRMMRALDLRTNAVDRRHLLSQVVKLTYAKRDHQAFRSICIEVGMMHLCLSALNNSLNVGECLSVRNSLEISAGKS